MRVPSVAAVLAAVMVVVHAAPGQDSTPAFPSTPEIVRMFSEPAASVEEVEVSESTEDDNDEAAATSNNQAKRSYGPPPPPPPKQFCIEIRPKNPSQSPFVICEPPTQPYYQYSPPQNPYPYKQAPPASHYPPVPTAYSPPTAPSSPKPFQRSDAMGSNADAATMMMVPLMGGSRNAGATAVMPSPMQFQPPGSPAAIRPMMQPSPGPAMMMPPAASGRSTYPQPYGSYDQPPPVTMQCHAPPGYQSYHGYQNPVALLQLFLKPSHHHHHHPGHYSEPAAAPSYRAANVHDSTPKPSVTTSMPNQTKASDNSTEGPLRIPILIDGVTSGAAHASQMSKGPHMTPEGSHPETKEIPGITAPGIPNPVFRPGGGAALLKPSNASTATLTAPKMSDTADIAVNLVDGPPPIERSGAAPAMMQPVGFIPPHEMWAEHSRSNAGNDMIMPENVMPGEMFNSAFPDVHL